MPEFTITKRSGKSFVIFYDECDEELIKNHTWHLAGKNPSYVKTNIRQPNGKFKSILFHRLVFQITDKNILIDHRNRNTLDNTRKNLRTCTKQKNNCNAVSRKNSTSKFKGVDWDSPKSRWRVQIQVDNKKIYIGRFKSEKEAALAYDMAAKIHHGEFAKLNF